MKTKFFPFRLLFVAALLTLLPLAARAQFDITTNDGAITVEAYDGTNVVVAIPAFTNGYPITTIDTGAFKFKSITDVIFSTNLATINGYAFEGCYTLTNISFANGILEIGTGAFAGCSALPDVSVPDSVTNLGISAFATCSSLTKATLPANITILPQNLFENCTSLAAVAIPAGVTDIAMSAFQNCPLTSVTLPAGLTTIGGNAFFGTSLATVTIPANVSSLSAYSFADCTNLTAINVDPSNTNFSSVDGVLFNSNQTTLLAYPDGHPGPYTVPSTVTIIGNQAFSYSAGLSAVTLPNSVTTIGYDSFQYCSALTSVVVGTGLTSIGLYGFEGCPDLNSIYFQGNAPSLTFESLADDGPSATVYYNADTTGWSGTTFGGLPLVMLSSNPNPISGVGIQNGQFGFSIAGTNGETVVIQATSSLSVPNWRPIQTNTLSGTTLNVTDPNWKSYPTRFYRFLVQ